MTLEKPPGGAVSRALVLAGWLPLTDRLIGGLCHALNGRASALAGLSQLLETDTKLDVSTHIADEVTKLGDVASRLQLLLGDPDGPAQPLVAGDLLVALGLLHESERGVRGGGVTVASAPGAPPIMVNWTAFSRVVLLVLSGVRSRGSSDGQIEVRAAPGPGGGLEIRVSVPNGEREASPAGNVSVTETGGYFKEGLDDALAVPGAHIEEHDDGGVTLRFPSMEQARQAGG